MSAHKSGAASTNHVPVSELKKYLGLWIASEGPKIIVTDKTFEGLMEKMMKQDNYHTRKFLVFRNHGKFII